jgi:hypothetical protein
MIGTSRLVGRRSKVLVTVVVAALAVGVSAAYGLGPLSTAQGTGALSNETAPGDGNSAFGYYALHAVTTSGYQTAVGALALSSVTNGPNTAVGGVALQHDTTGVFNTATGFGALARNVTGNDNTANGDNALAFNTTGTFNTAVGKDALGGNTGGAGNTAIGVAAGATSLVGGTPANTTGSYNTYVGFQAAPGTDNEINNATAIGANAVVSQSDSLVLGAANVKTGIHTTTPQSALQIGTGATTTFGDYLQIPVVMTTDSSPPAADCKGKAGRLVLIQDGKKMTLFACSTNGMWTKL